MKTDVFPINYFKSIWTPIQAFKNRFQLNGFQLILVIIFLNALITIPVTINFAQLDSLPLDDFYPKTVQMIDEQTVVALSEVESREGKLSFSTPFLIENEQGVVAGGVTDEQTDEILRSENALIFQENQYIIQETDAPTATVFYTRDLSFEGLETPKEVNEELSRQWFNQNRVLIVLFFSSMISAFLFIMTVFIVLGSAGFLYLTKKTDFTSITRFREAVNLILNVLALPTILAMITGLFFFDITIMVTIQYLGLVLMLFVIFYKIQFNDEVLAQKELEHSF